MSEMQRKIEAALAEFWDQQIIPSSDSIGGDPSVALDSLSACEVLLDVDTLVGSKIPVESVIRKGGYENRDQFISELTAAVMKHVGDGS